MPGAMGRQTIRILINQVELKAQDPGQGALAGEIGALLEAKSA